MTTPEGESAPVPVRQARQGDLLEVLRIEREAFPQPWPFSAFDRFVGDPGFLVADDGDGSPEVVGYVVADTVPNHGQALGHVKDLAVRADRRGEGIGSALLARALAVLESEGAATVKLEVRRGNEPARRLYEAFGFEHLRTVPRYYEDGEDALVLVR